MTLKEKFPDSSFSNVFYYTYYVLGHEQYKTLEEQLYSFFLKYKYTPGKTNESRDLSNLNYEEFAKELTIYILSLN